MAGRKIRILTLNCLFRNRARTRLEAIAGGLEEIAADVVCLQEVLLRRNVELLRRRHPTFQPWGPVVKGGLVTLTPDPVESWTFDVYRTALWFEWGARKGFLITRIRHGGTPVTVVNTHLLANYNEDWSPGNGYARRQVAELEQLAGALGQIPDEHLLVVAGDFNVPASSPIFTRFLESAGLVSAVDWSLFPHSRGSLAIDNVLYRPPAGGEVSAAAGLRFEEAIRLPGGRTAFPSDHVGVEAGLEW